ncbi:alkaline phosphatase [Corynebacterium sp. 13CS0277]|uniref:alkaline phosphatase D family protein n=1 Tax=Corynebacterium sp. 13CS0277 TaxID=2071994 RepID=UPI000D02A32C|nr:alkaline phosphatase D family protein [Corynebacterium sp. 13CS0277]PRQ10469.1 alkaline phosphatase [Corynebacterium sp. 13CS0277]
MVSRRRVLQATSAATLAAGATAASRALAGAADATAPAGATPAGAAGHVVFQHGVASGDPYPRSVILWTRVTSTPDDAPGSGRGRPVDVAWEVARDADFRHIVATGTVHTTPARDNTVKLEATGLEPSAAYYYRFRALGQTSPVGRTRTAPAPGEDVSRLRLALLSCANWEAGYFQAYRDLATRGDIDIAVHVGDYIYEYATGEYAAKGNRVIRPHVPAHETVTLADYRARYGHYHTDPDLQAGHAACPWIVTWDDHEVANDAWDTGAENHSADEGDYTARRDAAMQAYLEWLPIRGEGHIYRSLGFGRLFELHMLDLRSYRSEYVEYRAADNPDRTILGPDQYAWLTRKLTSNDTAWQIVGNPVMISPILLPPLDPELAAGITELTGLARDGYPYTSDTWDGFTSERHKLLSLLREKHVDNVVFVTGDIHTSWAGELPLIPARYRPGDYVAAEFVGPSVTSANIDEMWNLPDGSPIPHITSNAIRAVNPYLKYCDLEHHGYCVVEVTPDHVQCDWIFVTNKDVPGSPMWIAQSLRTEKGKGIFPAASPI